MNPAPDRIRIEAWYSGHVQGVGFRYSTTQVAREFEVSGTVQNLDDGRVHVVAEGSRDEVRAFLAELADQMRSYIRKGEESDPASPRGLTGFSIVR
ncbi:MAG: acylphosphatase [Opitutales bacterium]